LGLLELLGIMLRFTGRAIALDLRVGGHWGIWMVGPDGRGHAVDQGIQFLVTVLIGLV
jgi:hypothetical protein